ncbi:MAG TPA: hypothetical protein VGS41_00045, partial [Chthonomonadales bacterium]|nr:hypothetical protein [Chthonomonadales bacterium]
MLPTIHSAPADPPFANRPGACNCCKMDGPFTGLWRCAMLPGIARPSGLTARYSSLSLSLLLCLLALSALVAGPAHASEPATKAAYARAAVPSASITLLNQIGRLRAAVTSEQITGWKRKLHGAPLPFHESARLHLLLGEWELAGNDNPEQAIYHFHRAIALTDRSDRLHGLAAYDIAVARMYAGEFASAANSFRRLVDPKTGLAGYDRKT